MRRVLARCCLAVALTAGLGGCKDFLNRDNLQNDPNNPTSAGLDNLFISAQVNLTVQQTGQLARTVCIWMQQCSGQVPPFVSIGTYGVGEDDYYSVWAGTYGGGGLIDLRSIQTQALARGDSVYAGEAAILESMLVGMAADVWGDIPYSQAANPQFRTPALDSQQVVYDSVEKKLAKAIDLLAATGQTNVGPGAVDLVYGGDPAKWTALAHTLRARFFLHQGKRLGSVAYDSAFADAANGIAPGDDYTSVNASAPQSANLWSQLVTIYQNNIGAGAFLVNYMADSGATPDPRLAEYFEVNSDSQYVGADPGEIIGPSVLSTFAAARVDPGFLQPLVTAAENQLIEAEAALMKSAPSPALAATFLHDEQDAAGADRTPATLHNIMLEKYVALFQNIEVWNDWKRTGFPGLTPAPNGTIPRRLVYPLSERNANPSIAGPGPARNWNDPA